MSKRGKREIRKIAAETAKTWQVDKNRVIEAARHNQSRIIREILFSTD